jgi:hypothetical protein
MITSLNEHFRYAEHFLLLQKLIYHKTLTKLPEMMVVFKHVGNLLNWFGIKIKSRFRIRTGITTLLILRTGTNSPVRLLSLLLFHTHYFPVTAPCLFISPPLSLSLLPPSHLLRGRTVFFFSIFSLVP